MLSPGRLFKPVEKRALLGKNQPGAVTTWPELDGGERDRGWTTVLRQYGGVDDSPVRNDVVVDGLDCQICRVVPGVDELLPVDAEVELTVFPGSSLSTQLVFGNSQSAWLDVTRPHSTDLLGADQIARLEYRDVLHDGR